MSGVAELKMSFNTASAIIAQPGPLTVSVEKLEIGDEDRWDAFVARQPDARIYHLSQWRQLIRSVFGHESIYLCATRGKEVVGALPLVRLKSRLFGDYMVSMPYFNYGGAIADDQATSLLLVEAASEQARKLGCSHVEFRDLVPHPSLPARTDKVTMEMILPDTGEALWAGFTPKLRAQIRKPQKEGAEYIQGGSELLNDFYHVFARNMRDLGTPVYPKKFFEKILSTFPANARIALVRHKQTAVAAGFLLGYRDRLEIPWASSLREYNSLGVNMLLYAETLKRASEDGLHYFDFGRSSVNSGTYKFKKQWGSKERQLYWHYWLANGAALPQLTTANPKYQLAIALWKRLPLVIANTLGPSIVKSLP